MLWTADVWPSLGLCAHCDRGLIPSRMIHTRGMLSSSIHLLSCLHPSTVSLSHVSSWCAVMWLPHQASRPFFPQQWRSFRTFLSTPVPALPLLSFSVLDLPRYCSSFNFSCTPDYVSLVEVCRKHLYFSWYFWKRDGWEMVGEGLIYTEVDTSLAIMW